MVLEWYCGARGSHKLAEMLIASPMAFVWGFFQVSEHQVHLNYGVIRHDSTTSRNFERCDPARNLLRHVAGEWCWEILSFSSVSWVVLHCTLYTMLRRILIAHCATTSSVGLARKEVNPRVTSPHIGSSFGPRSGLPCVFRLGIGTMFTQGSHCSTSHSRKPQQSTETVHR